MKRRAACLAFLCCLACNSATPPPHPDLSGMEPDVAGLLAESRQAVLDDAGSAQAWGRLAAAYQAHRLLDEAERCCREAMRLAPEEFRWSYLLAVIREAGGADAEEVTELFERALSLRPDYAPAHLRLGLALSRRGLNEPAAASFRETIELAPDNARAHRALGQTLLAADRVAEAVQHLNIAARLRPEDGAAHSSLAQAHLRLGNVELAQRSAKRAAETMPVGGFADPVIDEEVRSLGASAALRIGRAQRLIASGDLNAAREEIARIREARPEEADTHYLAGLLAVRENELEEAELHYRRALERNADHLQAMDGLATVLERGGRLNEALNHRRRAQQLSPRDPARLLAMVPSLDALQDVRGLVETYEKLVALMPDSASARVDLGTALGRQGDFERAAEQFREAVRLDAQSVEGHYRLGVALELMGLGAEAIEQYEKTLALDPSHVARTRLEQLRGN